jgi:hypothetical protein
MSKDKDLITTAEAQKAFRIGRSTLFGLLRYKRLARYGRVGDRTIYISRAELTKLRTIKKEGAR